jgi:hypothetical protein
MTCAKPLHPLGLHPGKGGPPRNPGENTMQLTLCRHIKTNGTRCQVPLSPPEFGATSTTASTSATPAFRPTAATRGYLIPGQHIELSALEDRESAHVALSGSSTPSPPGNSTSNAPPPCSTASNSPPATPAACKPNSSHPTSSAPSNRLPKASTWPNQAPPPKPKTSTASTEKTKEKMMKRTTKKKNSPKNQPLP